MDYNMIYSEEVRTFLTEIKEVLSHPSFRIHRDLDIMLK